MSRAPAASCCPGSTVSPASTGVSEAKVTAGSLAPSVRLLPERWCQRSGGDELGSVEEVGAEIYQAVMSVASRPGNQEEALDYGEEEFVPWHLGTVM